MNGHHADQPIRWRIHLASAPHQVYHLLATDAGRASFWAESATEQAGWIDFQFPGEASWHGKILVQEPSRCFGVEYYGGSVTTFRLTDDGQGGTDLEVTDEGVPEQDRTEVTAGWVSVLMANSAPLMPPPLKRSYASSNPSPARKPSHSSSGWLR
jgi:uncharacterized protein YndB with AHSA1/START domain